MSGMNKTKGWVGGRELKRSAASTHEKERSTGSKTLT